MAIIKTCKISIYVMENKTDSLMDFLQKSDVIQIVGEPDTQKDIGYAFVRAEKAMDIVNRYNPKKRLLTRKSSAAILRGDERKKLRLAQDIADEIIAIDAKIQKKREEIDAMGNTISSLSGYSALDCPTELETEYCICQAGECRASSYDDLIKKGICSHLISREKYRVRIWIAYLKSNKKEAEIALQDADFKKCDIHLTKASPHKELEYLKYEISKRKKEVDTLEKRLDILANDREYIEYYYDKIYVKTEKYRAISQLKSTESVRIITGYVKEGRVEELIYEINQKFSAAAEIEKPDKDEILPTEFSNNALVAPVEEITASYSMPSDTDIDPNPITAFFYYWFFGMMFSDAGYGLLMMIVCGILGFTNIMDKERCKSYRLFFWCGVSTTLWGIAYGSFFGDLIGVISQTFGDGKTEFAPILLDPVNQALQLLIISAAFGQVHLITALAIKFYVVWKSQDKVSAVCDTGFWITALLGVGILSAGAVLKLDNALKIGSIIAILSGLGLVLTGGRDKKNPILKLLGGVMKLYDITGYVGDILSYSRLMALGLATGVIASVVNVLASLGGNSFLGAVVFVIVAVLGHTLNLSINMLGAYVHTNRLQYVEFYQKFYKGGGRRFHPFKINTKYFNFNN